jgi:hypothetical protein
MSCFFNQAINTCFAAMMHSQVKLNTTDYTDLHRYGYSEVFQSVVICVICGKKTLINPACGIQCQKDFGIE